MQKFLNYFFANRNYKIFNISHQINPCRYIDFVNFSYSVV